MNVDLPAHRRGVTAGYLVAAVIAASLWLGVGVLLLPLMLILALLHRWAAPTLDELAASHHHWLAAHHFWSVLVLSAVLIAPLAALPTLCQTATTVLNTLTLAPNPVETLAAAWPELNLPILFIATLILLVGWFVVTFWISWRLLRQGLRWADGRPAL
ncbi:MAG: hypothetical protein PF501_10370 [Salinisphaera sp.]|nr:hypothetical protein [Salinisphaera sp.]